MRDFGAHLRHDRGLPIVPHHQVVAGGPAAVGEDEEARRDLASRASHINSVDGDADAVAVEPGCYVRPAESVPERFWNIGVRIEDDALVTVSGCEILTAGAPKLVDEVEALMRDARGG